MNKNNFFLINSNSNISENKNEKMKYITNPNKLNSTYNSINCIGNPIDVESYLRNSENFNRTKMSIELNSKFSPNNYSVLYSNKKNNTKKKETSNNFNKIEPYKGPGRGSGNIDVSDNVRFGLDTRRYNDEYRNINEGLINDRHQIIDDSFQNNKNVVLPFPRGGVQTRDNKKLVKGNSNNDDRFKFQY